MGELEEKLNAILGDSQAMSQIMALAQSLGKSDPKEGEEASPAPPSDPPPAPEAEPGEDLLGGIDPQMLDLGEYAALGMRLLGEYQRQDEKGAALIQALRPFLREERQAKLDKAVRIAKLSRVARVALRSLGGGEGHV